MISSPADCACAGSDESPSVGIWTNQPPFRWTGGGYRVLASPAYTERAVVVVVAEPALRASLVISQGLEYAEAKAELYRSRRYMGKKTSVYLPDALAEQVRESGLPLSEIIRRGLEGDGEKAQLKAAMRKLDQVVDLLEQGWVLVAPEKREP